jgi:hypothetical protein
MKVRYTVLVVERKNVECYKCTMDRTIHESIKKDERKMGTYLEKSLISNQREGWDRQASLYCVGREVVVWHESSLCSLERDHVDPSSESVIESG